MDVFAKTRHDRMFGTASSSASMPCRKTPAAGYLLKSHRTLVQNSAADRDGQKGRSMALSKQTKVSTPNGMAARPRWLLSGTLGRDGSLNDGIARPPSAHPQLADKTHVPPDKTPGGRERVARAHGCVADAKGADMRPPL